MTIVGSNEILKKISSQVETQFPGFIREEGPQFVAFLKAYFEYMEQSGNAIHSARSIPDNHDIDRTVESFIEYFRKEFMVSIPQSVLADKRLLAKHIKEFYRSRGSQQSYRFLFRTLFDKEIDFYYPGDDILRASDGRWIQETRLRVAAPFSKNPRTLEGKSIKGATSGATAYVQDITATTALGIDVFDLTVEGIVGTFVDGERIYSVIDPTNYATINSQVGSIVSVDITDGGAFHNLDDRLSIGGAGSTEVATAIVTEVTNQSAVTLKIAKGGSGYTKEGTQLIVSGGNGQNFSAVVDSWSKETIAGLSINTDFIGPMRNVRLDTPSFFVRKGANTSPVTIKLNGTVSTSTVSNSIIGVGTSFTTQLQVGDIVRITGLANTARVHSIVNATSFVSVHTPLQTLAGANAYIKLAAANVYTTLSRALTFTSQELYTINSIALLNPGYGYTTLPTVRVVDSIISPLNIPDGYGNNYGNNAVIIANNAPGTIKKLSIITPGSNFNRYESADIYNSSQSNALFTESQSSSNTSGSAITKYLKRKKTFNGSGYATTSGVIRYPGRYIDTKGFLSWNNRLQDNDYYQEFSYVIRITEVLNKYKQIIKSLLHPAGTKMFGDYIIVSAANASVIAVDESPIIARRSIREKLTSTATASSYVYYADITAGTESVTTGSTANATFTANTFATESVTSVETADSVLLKGLSSIYVKVMNANSSISDANTYTVGSYFPVVIEALDGKPRYVRTITGTSYFANGLFKANSGYISVGGQGTSLYIIPVPGVPTESSPVYQINAIFSNTAFTLRSDYTPTTANARIWYSTT